MSKKKEKKTLHSNGKPCKGTIKKICNVQDYTLQQVVDENGYVTYVNVPFSTSDLDLGTLEMYNLETLLAAGIQPASIHTSNNNRITTHEKIEGMINDLDSIFESEFENNTQETIND